MSLVTGSPVRPLTRASVWLARLAIATLGLRCLASCVPGAAQQPIVVSLPSARPSGDPINDRVWVSYFPAQGVVGPAPTVVLLHPLGEERGTMMRSLAGYVARRGLNAAVMELAWHMHRHPRGMPAFRYYITHNAQQGAASIGQSAADVGVVVDWLIGRPDVDPRRIGVIGVSLGAIVAHLAMGMDDRLTAGVAVLGGGDLLDIFRRSVLFQVVYVGQRLRMTSADAEAVARVDPLRWADRNRPRRVLMVQAARDVLVPPYNAEELWVALGKPPIRWLDTNHYGPALQAEGIASAGIAYLQGVWRGEPNPRVPTMWAPTVKLGLLTGLDSPLEPALTWQAVTFLTRPDHMSLLHADVGWSGRGFFAAVAITVSAYLDVGVARRFNGRLFRPYASWHIVF